MSSNSTPNDIMRFVRLRSTAPEGTEVLRLARETNLAGELAGLARRARRERAEQWLRSSGRHILEGLADDPLYREVRQADIVLSGERSPPTDRDLFLYLADRGLFGPDDTHARRSLLERLSDVLLASYYAPTVAPGNIDEIRRAWIMLELVQSAVDAGIRADDLRPGGRGAGSDQELAGLLDAPYGLPETLEADITARFSVGIGDLLVVKQHIKRYEPSEIAHIENVLASERRERTHRRLDRTEEIFVTETESEVEQETELATTERFELSEEASRTIREEQQLSFGLSLSGKYGPTVEFGTEFEFSRRDSREETAKSSTSYAKEVVERSLERVRERVLRRRTTRILQELEETNLHAFNNDGSSNIVGLYQFVDKVYEAQVFDYGKREMFDLMVPEPASYLWHLRAAGEAEERIEEPQPPRPMPEDIIPGLLVEESGVAAYERWAARYRAEGLEAPPDDRMTISAGARYPEAEGGETPDPSTILLEVNVPPGYRPRRARLSAIAHSASDNHHGITLVGFVVLDRMSIRDIADGRSLPGFAGAYGATYLNPSTVPEVTRSDEVMLFGMSDTQTIELDGAAISEESPLQIGVFGYDTRRYVVSIDIECEATEALLDTWRLKTFEKLSGAYEARLLEYREEYSRYQQQLQRRQQEDNAERDFGAAPSLKEEVIRTELKKHCTAMITEDFFTRNDVPPVMEEIGSGPPRFRLDAARTRGALVRFLEQAFEWQHMQYVFYPYYWARGDTWEERFREDDPAHQFRQFQQAGWARIVVPVRPGFEEALHYYLQTGTVWAGGGAIPRIGDRLSLSIVEEIRAREDAGVLRAIPAGDPWEVRVPTSLIYLREDAQLPHWRRIDPRPEDDPANHWDWRPAEAGD